MQIMRQKTMPRTIHKARYVLSAPDRLLADAAIHVSCHGRVSSIEPWHRMCAKPEAEVMDWNSSVILPGLINAHTHLELTSFRNQLTRFSSFTDSLASNDSLSMIDEMRFLYGKRSDIRPEEIFRAATINGAKALSFGGVLGRLRRGYWADMTVLRLPPHTRSRNLLRQILEGAGECIATIVRGKVVYQKEVGSFSPPIP